MAETATRARARSGRAGVWRFAVLIEVALLVLLWQFVQGTLELWSVRLFPPPSDVIGALWDLTERGVLADHWWYSMRNAAAGFGLALAVGIPCGLLLGSSTLFYDVASPPFWAAYATPRIAFQPLLVLWLGFGAAPKILIVFLMALFPIAINTMDGIRSVDRSVVRAARVYGANRAQIFTKVELWAALPLILTGIRMGVARSMIGVVIGEFIGGSQGLGFLLFRKAGELEMGAAIGITVLLVVLAMIGMTIVDLIRRWIAPWYVEGVSKH